jgi:hypothetical protein
MLENRNHLTCKVTNKKRITNKSYLRKRLKALDITEEEFRKYYVCESARDSLKEAVEAGQLEHAFYVLRSALYPNTKPRMSDLRKVFAYNGKNKLFLAYLDSLDVETLIPDAVDKGYDTMYY